MDGGSSGSILSLMVIKSTRERMSIYRNYKGSTKATRARTTTEINQKLNRYRIMCLRARGQMLLAAGCKLKISITN